MSRNKGTFNFAANFEPLLKAPLDARTVVQNYTDLIEPSTWKDADGLIWLYDGLIVGVANDPSRGIYFLKESSTYTSYSSWEKASAASDISIGFINVGDGSAGVYIGYDSSGNIQLRTISGAGAAVVEQIGDQIIISLDASFAGEINYGVNIGDGDASIYAQKVGDALQFRTLKGAGSIIVSTSDNIILIDSSVVEGNYYTTLDPSLEMPSTVGGYPAGTTVAELYGDSFITMWDNLLFPTQYPVLTGPSASIAVNPTTLLYEVSSNVNLTFTSSLNRGSINPQYRADSPYRSGPPNNFDFTGIGLVDISTSANPYVAPAFDVSIPLGNLQWNVNIGYDEGVQPFDNKGNPYDSSLAAGSVLSNTITITGVYPLFATTVNITTMTKQSLVAMTTSGPITLGMAAESGGNKQAFEIPDAWSGPPTNNPLTGIRTYNSVSGNYEYQGGSAAASLTFWTTSGTTETIQGSVINYTKYTYNGTDRSSINIRLEF